MSHHATSTTTTHNIRGHRRKSSTNLPPTEHHLSIALSQTTSSLVSSEHPLNLSLSPISTLDANFHESLHQYLDVPTQPVDSTSADQPNNLKKLSHFHKIYDLVLEQYISSDETSTYLNGHALFEFYWHYALELFRYDQIDQCMQIIGTLEQFQDSHNLTFLPLVGLRCCIALRNDSMEHIATWIENWIETHKGHASDNIQVHLYYIMLLLHLNRTNESNVHVQAIQQEHKRNILLFVLKGDTLKVLGDERRALKSYSRCIALARRANRQDAAQTLIGKGFRPGMWEWKLHFLNCMRLFLPDLWPFGSVSHEASIHKSVDQMMVWEWFLSKHAKPKPKPAAAVPPPKKRSVVNSPPPKSVPKPVQPMTPPPPARTFKRDYNRPWNTEWKPTRRERKVVLHQPLKFQNTRSYSKPWLNDAYENLPPRSSMSPQKALFKPPQSSPTHSKADDMRAHLSQSPGASPHSDKKYVNGNIPQTSMTTRKSPSKVTSRDQPRMWKTRHPSRNTAVHPTDSQDKPAPRTRAPLGSLITTPTKSRYRSTNRALFLDTSSKTEKDTEDTSSSVTKTINSSSERRSRRRTRANPVGPHKSAQATHSKVVQSITNSSEETISTGEVIVPKRNIHTAPCKQKRTLIQEHAAAAPGKRKSLTSTSKSKSEGQLHLRNNAPSVVDLKMRKSASSSKRRSKNSWIKDTDEDSSTESSRSSQRKRSASRRKRRENRSKTPTSGKRRTKKHRWVAAPDMKPMGNDEPAVNDEDDTDVLRKRPMLRVHQVLEDSSTSVQPPVAKQRGPIFVQVTGD